MATNKWLNDIKTLKSTTDALRETLRDKNVTAYNTDTLPELVSKVPYLAPITLSDEDKWLPDPLWVFPDPNGSGEMKTIRQIYDEDTMAENYTYRAIYQITDDYDTIDLKKAMGSRTSADTFILSDGTVYTDITDTILNHTWDKTKDIIDSVGRKMRYVKVYTNTKCSYVLSFGHSSIWGVHKLHTNALDFGASQATADWSCMYGVLECLEVENTGMFYGGTMPVSLQKIVFNNPCTITSAMDAKNLKELIFSELSAMTSTAIFGNAEAPIKVFNISAPEKYTGTSFSLANSTSSQFEQIIGLENLTTVTSCTISDQHKLQTIILPPNTQTLSVNYCYSLKTFVVPNNCKTLVVNYCTEIRELTIPSSVTDVNVSANYNLRVLNVPADFNIAISISTSIFMEHDSLVNILDNLKDLSNDSSKKLTLGSVNLAKLTDEEKNIALNKNWTLA